MGLQIPEDTNIIFNPTTLLEVQFPQANGSAVKVKAGAQVLQPRQFSQSLYIIPLSHPLIRTETAIPPVFGIQRSKWADTPCDTFVVAMIDLDAPTPQNPNVSEIRHFLGDNFTLQPPDCKGLSLLSNSTRALSEFLQPAPPAGSDPHRYYFCFLSFIPIDQETLTL